METKRDGLLWVGTTEEAAGFDGSPSPGGRQALLAVVRRTLPALANAEVVRHTACLRPMTPDGLPIVGRSPGDAPAHVAGGGARKGIPYAPALGKALADQIAGVEPGEDLAPFPPQPVRGLTAPAGAPRSRLDTPPSTRSSPPAAANSGLIIAGTPA